MSTLPPSPFMNSAASPVVAESAAVDVPPPRVAAAEPISVSDGVPRRSLGAALSETEGAVSVSAAPSDISHIHEIFFYVRKLMKQPPRFVLDEAAFMADVEEVPLFIREDGYLKRQA